MFPLATNEGRDVPSCPLLGWGRTREAEVGGVGEEERMGREVEVELKGRVGGRGRAGSSRAPARTAQPASAHVGVAPGGVRHLERRPDAIAREGVPQPAALAVDGVALSGWGGATGNGGWRPFSPERPPQRIFHTRPGGGSPAWLGVWPPLSAVVSGTARGGVFCSHGVPGWWGAPLHRTLPNPTSPSGSLLHMGGWPLLSISPWA